jgi:hypothetical protein
MSRKMVGKIIEGVCLHDPYFRCKPDTTGKLGFSSYSLRSIILFANIDVSRHILVVDTSIFAKSIMGQREYKKCSAAIQMLAHGVAGDLVDEYMRMSESTYIDSMYNFYRAIISVFGDEYLREPNMEDTQQLLSINEKRGFPGILGSIDCMYWE